MEFATTCTGISRGLLSVVPWKSNSFYFYIPNIQIVLGGLYSLYQICSPVFIEIMFILDKSSDLCPTVKGGGWR